MSCEFVFICDKTWEELTPTDDPRVKDCNQCGKAVTFCKDFKELTECAKQQKCVCYFNPEAKSSAIHWDKKNNKIEFIHDANLSQAEKNKITSVFIHEYTTAFPSRISEVSTGDARIEAMDKLQPILGMIRYGTSNQQEINPPKNESDNPFQREPKEMRVSLFTKVKHFLFRK